MGCKKRKVRATALEDKKIGDNSRDLFEFRENGQWLRVFLGLATLGILWIAAIELNQNTPQYFKIVVCLLGALLLGFSTAILRTRCFHFDRIKQKIIYSCRNLIKNEVREFGFSEIQSIRLIKALDIHRQENWQITFELQSGTMPLNENPWPRFTQAEKILSALKELYPWPVIEPDPADLIRDLVVVGRKIEAIAALRSSKNMGLAQAKAEIEELAKSLKK